MGLTLLYFCGIRITLNLELMNTNECFSFSIFNLLLECFNQCSSEFRKTNYLSQGKYSKLNNLAKSEVIF